MKRHSTIILLIVAAAFLAVIQFTKKEPDYGQAFAIDPIKAPKRVAAALAKVFPAPDAETIRAIEGLVDALQTKDLERAVMGIRALEGLPNQTFEQARVLKGLTEGLQKEVVQGLARGDANSVAADAALKRAPCCTKTQ